MPGTIFHPILLSHTPRIAAVPLVLITAAVLTACGGGNTLVELKADRAAFPLVETTAEQFHAAMRNGDVSCRDVVQGYLDRIAAYDAEPSAAHPTSPALRSVIAVNPAALRRADELDELFFGHGLMAGRLHCVPVLAKDNYDTADMKTTAGSLALANNQPPDDAYVIRKLREADAIIIGKANMDEFAFGFTGSSSVDGKTRNAYIALNSAGGSSSDTGTSVTANLAMIGLGTDTASNGAFLDTLQAALDKMRAAGAVVVDVDIPDRTTVLTSYASLSSYEFRDDLTAYLGSRSSSGDGHLRSTEAVADALTTLEPTRVANFRTYVTNGTNKASNPIYLNNLKPRDEYVIPRVQAALDNRDLSSGASLGAAYDVLIYPVLQGFNGASVNSGSNNRLSAFTGYPAMAFPAGFARSSNTATSVEPVSLEMIGRPFAESTLLRLQLQLAGPRLTSPLAPELPPTR